MDITQDKIDLISKLIKNDRKYLGNEDLYEDFLSETCRNSAAIINAIDNPLTLEAYLRKIVTTSILKVLKDSGRLRRTRSGYMTTTEVPLEAVVMPAATAAPVVSEAPEVTVPAVEKFDYSSHVVDYSSVKIPRTPEENAIQNEILDFVADTIQDVDIQEPEQKYMELFLLRYDRGMTQKEIASQLDISQSEVSKRLYGLIEKVKKILDEQ